MTQFYPQSSIVLTNCTGRKKLVAEALTLDSTSVGASLGAIARAWRKTIDSCSVRRRADDLYLGRSFRDAQSATVSLGADLYVVSAGLGLVRDSDLVPGYDLTVTDQDGPLLARLNAIGATTTDWWSQLARMGIGRGPLQALLTKELRGLVFVAMPSAYLRMIEHDLGMLPPETLEKVRIFSSVAGVQSIKPPLKRLALPYDERLETLPAYQGTRTDFAQRALRHFVEVVRGHELPLHCAAEAVKDAMDSLNYRIVPDRKRLTDDAIATVLRKHWNEHRGSSTQLLRILRDKEGIACEQGRFRDIWRALRAERSIATESS